MHALVPRARCQTHPPPPPQPETQAAHTSYRSEISCEGQEAAVGDERACGGEREISSTRQRGGDLGHNLCARAVTKLTLENGGTGSGRGGEQRAAARIAGHRVTCSPGSFSLNPVITNSTTLPVSLRLAARAGTAARRVEASATDANPGAAMSRNGSEGRDTLVSLLGLSAGFHAVVAGVGLVRFCTASSALTFSQALPAQTANAQGKLRQRRTLR